jgi:hypothetical protein
MADRATPFPSSILPHRITQVGSVFTTEIIKFENGTEQRFSRDNLGRIKYRFEWNAMSLAEFTTLQNYFNGCRGKYLSFDYMDSGYAGQGERLGPDSIEMRFDSDALTGDKINHHYVNVSVEVITC